MKLEKRHISKDLSLQRVRVLLEISENDKIKMNELAQKMDVRSRTITDIVDSLEQNGYVERTPDTADRRATRLRLTPKAKDLVDTMQMAMKNVASELFATLTVEQQGELFQILTLLYNE